MARDTRLLIFRGAALAFWVACVIFLLVPGHTAHAKRVPFHGGGPMPAPAPNAHVM
jgi:hypothetical protein